MPVLSSSLKTLPAARRTFITPAPARQLLNVLMSCVAQRSGVVVEFLQSPAFLYVALVVRPVTGRGPVNGASTGT